GDGPSGIYSVITGYCRVQAYRLPDSQRCQSRAVQGVPLVVLDHDAEMRDPLRGHGPLFALEGGPRLAEGELLADPLAIRPSAIVRQRDGQHIRPRHTAFLNLDADAPDGLRHVECQNDRLLPSGVGDPPGPAWAGRGVEEMIDGMVRRFGCHVHR